MLPNAQSRPPRATPASIARRRRPQHREFPAGYSLAGCSPAEPASASPAAPVYVHRPVRRNQLRCPHFSLTIGVHQPFAQPAHSLPQPRPIAPIFRDRTSSITPAFSHLRIKRITRRSPTRCSTKRINHSWSTASKNTTTHYPSPRLSTFGDNPARAASLRGPRSASAGRHAPPRRSIAAGCAPRRQPLTDPGGVHRFGGNARRGTRRRD